MEKSLAERVKALCADKGIALKDLAERMGIKPESLSRALYGNPRLSTLNRVAEALEVAVTDLFGGGTSNNPSPSDFMAMVIRDGKGYCFHNEQRLRDWLEE